MEIIHETDLFNNIGNKEFVCIYLHNNFYFLCHVLNFKIYPIDDLYYKTFNDAMNNYDGHLKLLKNYVVVK